MGVVALRDHRGCTTFTGTRAEVQAHLRRLVAQGRLRPDGWLGSGPAAGGLCYARVRLVDIAPKRQVRRGLVAAAGIAAATVLAVITWAVVVVVAWVVAHIVQIIAALVVLAILVAAVLAAGGGKHCPGCKG